MVITIRIEIDDDIQEAITLTHSYSTKATKKQIGALVETLVKGALDDIKEQASSASDVISREIGK